METDVGYYFKKISEKLEKQANCKKIHKEITYAQGKILWYLHKHENEPVGMRDIEKYFDCSHATVFGIVSRLVEKGYVYLEPNPSDKRSKLVKMTEKEMQSFSAVKRRRRETENKLLKGFSDEDKKQICTFLDRIYQNLADEE